MRVFTEKYLIAKYKPKNPAQFVAPFSGGRLYFRILRKAGMYLRVEPGFDPTFAEMEEDVDGSRRRFARTFRETWLFIGRPARGKPRPSDERNYRADMLDAWQAGRDGMPWVPRISLEDGVARVGAYQRLGAFEFNSCAIELVDKAGFLRDLIGHELAHAWWDTQPNSFIRSGGSQKQIEDEANTLANAWGFRMAALRTWWLENKPALKECGVQVDGLDAF